MEIKNQYEENGYRITEYANGTVVQEVIISNENIELTEQLTEEQLHRLKIESDLEIY
ncbi:MAG: hypothetical protein K2L15_01820 [Eubacteriales bacterium]|nr:hypothetical protein [Eubacteriales bacterium]